ncbi:MAG: ATP-binding protein [Clostridia bacterium]|nr:ATP-binding protein [Clostridia bacterium]
MNETGRVTSTARKISRSWLWRLFWIFLRMNLVLLILAALGFCFYQERLALGSQWEPDLQRELEIEGVDATGNLRETAEEAIDSLRGASYVFYDADGVRYEVACRAYVDAVGAAALVLLAIEALIFLGQMLSGRKKARRLLRPLDRMARAAELLGRSAGRVEAPPQNDGEGGEVGGEKLHGLEDAIGRISPEHPEEKLDMGDSDLQGLEDAINGLLSRMHEAYRQQAQFVSDASHELRTPIAVIQGYAGMLDRWGKQDEKVLDESIAAIKSEAGYMSKLVEQLLFLARGDTGRNRMEFKEISLGELMEEVCEDCRVIDKSHDYRLEKRSEARCSGDWDMLKQCARILADNALKYTPQGGLICLRTYVNAAGEACLEVQDSGIGVSAEDMQHMFDRFYRSDPARARQSGGTGLGLAIARWIVDRHGGHFEVLSREGLGTRMTVCLPAAEKIE